MTEQQREYYAETATVYDSMHVQPGDEHFIALEYAAALLHVVRAKSVLDVGSGTGRAVRFLRGHHCNLQVEGVEPVRELREQAEALGTTLHHGSGTCLPFEDDSFDVVMSFGLLHHVADPVPVVREMARVARSGVLISDANRFGQGSVVAAALKLLLHRVGLWPMFERIRTRGRGYIESPGDGIFYSYSIFDSMQQLMGWADRVFIIPTVMKRRVSVLQIAASHGLLVAFREPAGSDWAGR